MKLFSPFSIRVDEACDFARFTSRGGRLADGKVTGVTCEDDKLADGKVTGVTCEDSKLADGKITGITCGGGKLADVTCVNGTLPSDVDKLESTEEDERKGSGVNISGELDSLEDLKKLVKANWVFCFPPFC